MPCHHNMPDYQDMEDRIIRQCVMVILAFGFAVTAAIVVFVWWAL